MRKDISMPIFLVEAVKDIQEAFNIYSQSNSKRFKEKSFSATICHLISRGIDREFELTQKADKDMWIIKENFDRFKQHMEAAQQKSQEFDIDRPHRKKTQTSTTTTE